MALSVNKVILVGNAGRDPETRQAANGRKIVSFTLATSETWKDKTGGQQEKTEWHRIVIFNQNLANFAEQYVRKGSKLYIEGALQTRKYTDGSGVEKSTTEIVLNDFRGELISLDKRGASGDSFASAPAGFDTPSASAGWDSKPASAPSAAPGGFDDDIPF